MTTIEYVKSIIRNNDILNCIKFVITTKGYKVNCCANGILEMHMPLKMVRWYSIFTKLTLRHEIGHIIVAKDVLTFSFVINMVLLREHKIFCKLQKIWYWNTVFRWIRRKLGYSINISYKTNDLYPNIKWTIKRWEVELFCDWYAVKGYKIL